MRDWNPYIGTIINDVKILSWVDINKTNRHDKINCECLLCGSIFQSNIHDIVGNNTKRCFKCGRKISAEKRMKQNTIKPGTTFGFLTIIKQGEPALDNEGYNASTSICKCNSCGNICVIKNHSLKHGNVNSCGCITSIGEKLTQIELNKYNIDISKQYTFADLRSSKGGRLKFDFAILKEKNLIALIEYQGIPHYKDTGEFMKQQREETDALKKEYCKAHNIPLYEIKYDEDVEQRINEILTELNLI